MIRHVGLIAYDNITALDLAGPLEVFDGANRLSPDSYRVHVLGISHEPVRAESGLQIVPAITLDKAPALDTIIIPGGAGLREEQIAAPIAAWLDRRRRTRRIASVCTGIYALARTGMLDGCRATTHWRFAADVKRRFPKVHLEPDAIFLRDGNLFTSAGVTAGIDLALSFVEADLGARVALGVARDLVVYLKRAGGQLQYSEPLQFQTLAFDRFSDLACWAASNLKADLSVAALATRVGLGVRQFNRKFVQIFGVSPATYVEQLRLDESRRRLIEYPRSVDSVAASVGYASADSFRRAFERRFGVPPSVYRDRFANRTDVK